MEKSRSLICFSIVSHGQSALVLNLLADLDQLTPQTFEVVITINICEDTSGFLMPHPYPIKIINNKSPRGFGANHNAAFAFCHSDYFAVVNPDIRIDKFNLEMIVKPFEDMRVAAVAPLVVSESGKPEDSARHFPTFFSLLGRFVQKNTPLDYGQPINPISVDWVGGMFILFRPKAFKEVGGFDEKRYFMYMEDVDICRRLHQKGWEIIFQPLVSVIHQAQRASHHNFKHLRWHLTSAFRYLLNI